MASKLQTLCPVPAGSAIIRDNRAWHGGTPNLNGKTRTLANVEYYAPGFKYYIPGWDDPRSYAMPRRHWSRLSPFAQHVAREVVAAPEAAAPPPGEGKYSPYFWPY
eukprot:TRINITY_DN47231_c0_g2_i1.p1 TRINITY_DN47231_c0_g2~~TRINITY_DN47231_c0_g2_i1.p1  ORF type:complete len:106 (+),score=20.49 TRINITY_DN47231_c0_g2_i1:402-719(+)